jgi:hypothetical protein
MLLGNYFEELLVRSFDLLLQKLSLPILVLLDIEIMGLFLGILHDGLPL